MKFDFNFGKKKPDIIKYVVVGVVLSSIIATLSQCTGVSKNGLWDLLDEVQRKYFPQTILNDFVIKDSKKLNRRIIRDIDRAISDYWEKTGEKPVKIHSPIFSEKLIDESLCYTNECKSLGGEMRLCSPWNNGCTKN